MTEKGQSMLLELIPHSTQTRPFSLHYTQIPKGEESILYQHWHPEMELWYLVEGEAVFFIEESEYHLKAGEAVFIPPDLLHYATAEKSYHGDCAFHAAVFAQEMICGLASGGDYEAYLQPVIMNKYHCVIHLTTNEVWQCECLQYINEIFRHESEEIREYELSIRGYLLLVWQQMYNHVFAKLHKQQKVGRQYQELLQVIDYIKLHYMEDMSLKQMAKMGCLSEGQFCRSFKKVTGETPFQYLNKVRTYKSCELLKESNWKIAEIASACGFNNISYFNREFYKRMKMTPSTYRKEE